MDDFGAHPRLFFAFSALLRGGNPEVIMQCEDLMVIAEIWIFRFFFSFGIMFDTDFMCFSYQVASYRELQIRFESVQSGTMICQKVVKRILGFLGAINSLEIYNVDSTEEMIQKRDELHSTFLSRHTKSYQ